MGKKSKNTYKLQDLSKQTRLLTSQEVVQLISSCDVSTKRGQRDSAILKIFLYLGLSVRELVALAPESIVKIDESKKIHALMGTHRTQVIRLPEKANKALITWIDTLNQSDGHAWKGLFVRVLKNDRITNRPMTPRQIRNVVAEYGYKAGLTPKKGNYRLKPTDLRRTCARNAYDNGARLLDVQAMLDQSKPLSTARFIDILKFQDPNRAVQFIHYPSKQETKG
jgi:site-specific recombinase XerD